MNSEIFNSNDDYLLLISDIKEAVTKHTKSNTNPKCIVVIQDGADIVGVLNCKNFHAIRFLKDILNAITPSKH